MTRIRPSICALGFLLALAPATAFSDTIIISETPDGTTSNAPEVSIFQYAAASWTTTSTYSNVAISAEVFCFPAPGCVGESIVNAYLTTAIGPSETLGDQIATYTDTTAGAVPEMDTLFSGLTLGPGTYYLVLGNGNIGVDYWFGPDGSGGGGTTITTDSGVTFNGDYFSRYGFNTLNASNPPASSYSDFGDWGLNFQVTGDSTIPEPSSISLVLIGMASGLYLLRRRLTA